MASGRSPKPGLAIALLASLTIVFGGCVTVDDSARQSAERRAAIDRWDRCVEARSARTGLLDARAAPTPDCDGYRRDVLAAFPPHLAPRVQRLMDERTERHERARLSEHGREIARDPRVQWLIRALSPGRPPD